MFSTQHLELVCRSFDLVSTILDDASIAKMYTGERVTSYAVTSADITCDGLNYLGSDPVADGAMLALGVTYSYRPVYGGYRSDEEENDYTVVCIPAYVLTSDQLCAEYVKSLRQEAKAK